MVFLRERNRALIRTADNLTGVISIGMTVNTDYLFWVFLQHHQQLINGKLRLRSDTDASR